MDKNIFCFLITTLAGCSTLLGIIPSYLTSNSKKVITCSLSFSAGVMLTISLFSLIPEAVVLLSEKFYLFPAAILAAIFIVIGILFSAKVDQKIDNYVSNNRLYKLGLISIIVIFLHNIPEGITTFISTSVNTKLGLSLSLAIALHNIPEGISIAVPIYYSTGSHKKAFWYTFFSGFSELFGAVIAYLFIAKHVNNMILSFILATTAGIMMHISIYELLPNSFDYKDKKATIISFILGAIVMLTCEFVFHI